MMQPETVTQLAHAALAIRRKFLQMHFANRSGHIGTGLSAIDLLTYLYEHWLAQDSKFILSKGHGASALYATLHHTGAFSDALIDSYYQDGTLLPAHPAPNAHPNIPVATGSLGHGLPVAVGMAYASKHLDHHPRRIVCMLSDGECNEGSVWEAAMFAAHHKLTNLTVIVDANGLQGFGKTKDVINLEPLAQKWRAFHFDTHEIDGHRFETMDAAFVGLREGPRCVVARTVKGKGVSFMENRLEWHYLPMKPEHLEQAMLELAVAEEGLRRAG